MIIVSSEEASTNRLMIREAGSSEIQSLMLGFAFTVQVYCCTADDSDHQVFEKPWGIVILDRYGHIAKNNVTFDYQIHSGRGGESNALALLGVFDFSEEIIKDANTYLEYRL